MILICAIRRRGRKGQRWAYRDGRGRARIATRGGDNDTRASHAWDNFLSHLRGAPQKPTPFWDDLGCGGIPGRGVGARSAPIAVIADIARHRRNREGKGLPLIHTDDADQENQTIGEPGHREIGASAGSEDSDRESGRQDRNRELDAGDPEIGTHGTRRQWKC